MNTTDSWEMVKPSLHRREQTMMPPGCLARSLQRVYAVVLVVCLGAPLGCGREQDEAAGAKSAPASAPSGILRVKLDEITRAGIEVRPVTRGAFRFHREFPATVQPNENELAEVTSLIRGRVVAAASPHAVFAGTIAYIGVLLDLATRAKRLRVTVANPDKFLKFEIFARVRVYAALKSGVLAVPLAAVQSGPAGKMVFVRQDEDQFEARAVKLGEETEEVAVVLDGLREGEQVVTKGAFVLKSEAEKYKIEPAR